MAAQYAAHVLPLDGKDLTSYARKYGALRLNGLKQSPNAFSSTHASELALTEDEQVARLQRPQQRIVVVVAVAAEQEQPRHWLDEEWVAQVTLVGPLSREQYDAPFSTQAAAAPIPSPPTKDDGAVYWHMTALYVDTAHRQKGLANLLCETSFQHAGEAGRGVMRIIIKPDNTAVIDMYKGLGFVVAEGHATLAEATVAAGEGALLPATYETDTVYTARTGIIMTRPLG